MARVYEETITLLDYPEVRKMLDDAAAEIARLHTERDEMKDAISEMAAEFAVELARALRQRDHARQMASHIDRAPGAPDEPAPLAPADDDGWRA